MNWGRLADIALLGTAWLGMLVILAATACVVVIARGDGDWGAIALAVPITGAAILGLALLTPELRDLLRPNRPGRKP